MANLKSDSLQFLDRIPNVRQAKGDSYQHDKDKIDEGKCPMVRIVAAVCFFAMTAVSSCRCGRHMRSPRIPAHPKK